MSRWAAVTLGAVAQERGESSYDAEDLHVRDHRTIQDYVSAVTEAGPTLTALRECEPAPARFNGHTDELARRRRVPLFLLLNPRV